MQMPGYAPQGFALVVLRPGARGLMTVFTAMAIPNRANAATTMNAANETLTWRVSVSGVGPSNFMRATLTRQGLRIGCIDTNVS